MVNRERKKHVPRPSSRSQNLGRQERREISLRDLGVGVEFPPVYYDENKICPKLKIATDGTIPGVGCTEGFVLKVNADAGKIICPADCPRIKRGEVTQDGLLTEKGRSS